MRSRSARRAVALVAIAAVSASAFSCGDSDDPAPKPEAEPAPPVAPPAEAKTTPEAGLDGSSSDAETPSSKLTGDVGQIRALVAAARKAWCEVAVHPFQRSVDPSGTLLDCYGAYPTPVVDTTACVADDRNGYPFFVVNRAAFENGNVLLDREQRSVCLARLLDLKSIVITRSFVDLGSHQQAYNACATAFHGKLAVGQGCSASIECDDGFCDTSAGPGVCRALRKLGETCLDSPNAGDRCARLGELGADYACLSPDGDAAVNACALTRPSGASCSSDHDCLSGFCGSSGVCVLTEARKTYACSGPRYAIRDAGGGG